MKKLRVSDSFVNYSYYLPADKQSSFKARRQVQDPEAFQYLKEEKGIWKSNSEKAVTSLPNESSPTTIFSKRLYIVVLFTLMIYAIWILFFNKDETQDQYIFHLNRCYTQYANQDCEENPLVDHCIQLTQCILEKKIPNSISKENQLSTSIFSDIWFLLTPLFGFATKKAIIEIYVRIRQMMKVQKKK